MDQDKISDAEGEGEKIAENHTAVSGNADRIRTFKSACRSYLMCKRELEDACLHYDIPSGIKTDPGEEIAKRSKAQAKRKSARAKHPANNTELAKLDSKRCSSMQEMIRYVDRTFNEIERKYGRSVRDMIWHIYVEGISIEAAACMDDMGVSSRTLNRRIRDVMTEIC